MTQSSVVSILIDKRSEAALKVQEQLTAHGCSIHARFGLHDSGGAQCSEEGLIILYLVDKAEAIEDLEKSLSQIQGVRVNSMKIK